MSQERVAGSRQTGSCPCGGSALAGRSTVFGPGQGPCPAPPAGPVPPRSRTAWPSAEEVGAVGTEMGVGIRAGGEGRLACQEMEACRPVRQLAMQPWTSAAKAPCHTVPSVRRLVRTCSELRAAVWLATVTGCFFTFFLVTLACGWSSGMGGQDEVGRREVTRRQRPTQAWFEELAHSPDPVPKPSALQQQNRRRAAQRHTPARRQWPWAPRRWPPPRRRARRLPPQPRLPPAAQLHSGGSTRAITTLSQQAGPQGANQAPANQPHDPAQTRLALSASASAIGWSAAAAAGAGASSSTWKSCRGHTPAE